MKINRINFCFVLFLALFFVAELTAQTARWTIPPRYSAVTPVGEGMYKVKSGRSVGILDGEGKTIVPVTADTITPFTEDCALVLGYEESRMRLKGILHADRKMIPIIAEWYVDEFPFFSEGKLPVHLKNGKYGYINTSGNVVLDFDYGSVHPFSEGWAAVCKGKNIFNKGVGLVKKNSKDKVFYVDERGRILTLQSAIGDIYMGTSFKNGEALVITKENKYCVINTSGQLMRIDNNIALIFDEKYALETEEHGEKKSDAAVVVYDGPTVFTADGRYGYQQEGKIVLPAQFQQATPFSRGFAIASVGNKYGVLKLLPGSFQLNSAKGSLNTADAGSESINYVVSVPDGWKDGSLELTCTSASGTKVSATQPGDAGNDRVFSFILPKGERTLSLSGENLMVWESGMISSFSTSKADDITISIVPSTAKANVKDNASIVVNLTNNTAAAIELTVKVTGDRLQSVNRKIEVAAGQTEKISTYFTKVTEEESRTVTVSTSHTTNAVSRRIKLVPFFVKY